MRRREWLVPVVAETLLAGKTKASDRRCHHAASWRQEAPIQIVGKEIAARETWAEAAETEETVAAINNPNGNGRQPVLPPIFFRRNNGQPEYWLLFFEGRFVICTRALAS